MTLVVLAACTKDMDDTDIQNINSEVIYTILPDLERPDGDIAYIWLSDSEGNYIDSSFYILPGNEKIEILRPPSFTEDVATVNLIEFQAENFYDEYNLYQDIKLPALFNNNLNQTQGIIEKENGPLHDVVISIEISKDDLYERSGRAKYPENFYARSLNVLDEPELEPGNLGSFIQYEFEGDYFMYINIKVKEKDEIIIYNDWFFDPYRKDELYALQVSYDKAINGDTIFLSNEDVKIDTDAEIIEMFPGPTFEPSRGFRGKAFNGSSYENSTPDFDLVGFIGEYPYLGIPSPLKGMDYYLTGTARLTANEEYLVRRSCYTTNPEQVIVRPELIPTQLPNIDFQDVFNFNISNVLFKHDFVWLTHWIREEDEIDFNRDFWIRLYLDKDNPNFVFSKLPPEISERIVGLKWSEDLFTGGWGVSFRDFDYAEDFNMVYNTFYPNSAEDVNRARENNCTISMERYF